VVDNALELEFPQERLPDLLDALRRRDEAVADLVEVISQTGRRPEGLRGLTWAALDREKWTLKIAPEKRGKAVLVGLDGALRTLLDRRLAARQLGCELIFHRNGRAMRAEKDRQIFADACKELELPYGRDGGYTIYTVKSTAVGVMHDAGLTDGEIMDRTGHRTDSMMRRYLKQNPERAHAASLKLEAYLAEKRRRRVVESRALVVEVRGVFSKKLPE
jgi:integrase